MCIDEVEFIIVGGLCGCNYCGVFGLGVGIIRGSTVADDFMIALVSNVIRELPFEGRLEFEVWACMFDVCEYGILWLLCIPYVVSLPTGCFGQW